MLLKAANIGIGVRIWYVGLASIDLHLERVRSCVAHGGHDIPEELIRARYDSSRRNLIVLLPHVAELKLIDNSKHGDPASGASPTPVTILHIRAGRIAAACALTEAPGWAKPIVQAAIQTYAWPSSPLG